MWSLHETKPTPIHTIRKRITLKNTYACKVPYPERLYTVVHSYRFPLFFCINKTTRTANFFRFCPRFYCLAVRVSAEQTALTFRSAPQSPTISFLAFKLCHSGFLILLYCPRFRPLDRTNH